MLAWDTKGHRHLWDPEKTSWLVWSPTKVSWTGVKEMGNAECPLPLQMSHGAPCASAQESLEFIEHPVRPGLCQLNGPHMVTRQASPPRLSC